MNDQTDPAGIQTWADRRADQLGIPRQPWPELEWSVIEEYKGELEQQQAGYARLLESLQTASTVAAGAALASGAPDAAPLGALLGSDHLTRLQRTIQRELATIHGERLSSALRGWFAADDLDALRWVFGVLEHEAHEKRPTTTMAAQLLKAIHGEWLDLLDEGSPNDIGRDEADDDEDTEAAPVPGRASGPLVGGNTPMGTYPDILREAVAVTVARLPFSCPEAWELWQGAVVTVFLQLGPEDADDEDAEAAG